MTLRNGLASFLRPEEPVLGLTDHQPSLWEQPVVNRPVPTGPGVGA
ncbi:hypothetical protein [Brevundimonas sp. Root1423]|nr:hypothetical protein [Brevundimonas sp. Root1423]